MRNYIVRIYRDSGERGDGLIGTVEAVGEGRKRTFKNPEELWAILQQPGQRPRDHRKSRTIAEDGS